MATLNLLIAKWYLLFVFVYGIPGVYSLYWSFRPIVSFTLGTFDQTFVGSYADYSNYQLAVIDSHLVLATENEFGCTAASIESSNTSIPSPYSVHHTSFVIMMPLSYDHCADYKKAYKAHELGAAGVVFYHILDSADDSLHSRNRQKIQIPVAAIEISEETLNSIRYQLESSNTSSVTVRGKYYQSLQTSQTFYFVVFSFCILTILSCLWFILSYVRKCRTASQRRQRRAQAVSETRRLVNNLPLKTHKSQQGVEEPTCAICLEMFNNKDTIRVLPCNHEFHKRCIDPWLKLKRTCPMCKVDISKQKSTTKTPTRTHQTRAVNHTRSPSVSTNDSGLHLLFGNSSDSEHTSSSEVVSATNPIPLDYVTSQRREEENDSQTLTVVMFDRAREEDQQGISDSPMEYTELISGDGPRRQVAIGIEDEGKDQLPALNIPA